VRSESRSPARARWGASPPPPAAAGPRIVVVGAGLAGLTGAYRLKQAGYPAELHEASDRVGGRCWTLRGVFAEGQLGERGDPTTFDSASTCAAATTRFRRGSQTVVADKVVLALPFSILRSSVDYS
jgi:thioredoxin reductase